MQKIKQPLCVRVPFETWEQLKDKPDEFMEYCKTRIGLLLRANIDGALYDGIVIQVIKTEIVEIDFEAYIQELIKCLA